MLHTLKILSLILSMHRGPVARMSADHYAIGHGRTVITHVCTVSTDGLTARLDASTSKPWLYFYDASGEREADCEVLAIVTTHE